MKTKELTTKEAHAFLKKHGVRRLSLKKFRNIIADVKIGPYRTKSSGAWYFAPTALLAWKRKLDRAAKTAGDRG